jgi:hypothetical protein
MLTGSELAVSKHSTPQRRSARYNFKNQEAEKLKSAANAVKPGAVTTMFDVPGPSIKKRLGFDSANRSFGTAMQSPAKNRPTRNHVPAHTSTGSNFFPNAVQLYASEIQSQADDLSNTKAHRKRLRDALDQAAELYTASQRRPTRQVKAIKLRSSTHFREPEKNPQLDPTELLQQISQL